MALGSTVLDLRQRNRARVLRSIVLAGETTRAQIAATCRLSSATITNVVSDLIADGLVQEAGSLPSDGGRPIARISTRAEGAYFIGADVGEHGVMVELLDLSLHVVDRVFNELPASIATADEVGESVTTAVDTIRHAHPEIRNGLVGMGLGVPGLVDRTDDGRTMIYAQNLGWPIIDLHDLCRIDDVPILADNGAKTLTMAEQWFGAARGVEHCIVALIGRGIGIGVISDGKLLRGLSSSAGEWGHAKISIGGPQCTCGGRGCLEAYVGGGSIVARWRESVGGDGTDEEAFAQMLDRAAAGDAAATAILDETVELLGIGLANLVNLLNPAKIVIGGWAGMSLHAVRCRELAAAVRTHSLKRPGEQFTLEPCALGGDAVALGAALLPLEQLIDGNVPLPKVST